MQKQLHRQQGIIRYSYTGSRASLGTATQKAGYYQVQLHRQQGIIIRYSYTGSRVVLGTATQVAGYQQVQLHRQQGISRYSTHTGSRVLVGTVQHTGTVLQQGISTVGLHRQQGFNRYSYVHTTQVVGHYQVLKHRQVRCQYSDSIQEQFQQQCYAQDAKGISYCIRLFGGRLVRTVSPPLPPRTKQTTTRNQS